MNEDHLELLVSEGWRNLLRDFIIPYALADVRLGDDVLEVGPGPGMTTDLLRVQVAKLTAVESDPQLADALMTHLAGTNVEVLHADATAMPFEAARFSAAVSFTMLHHVPTRKLQDDLFADVARVLRPGGVFVASDSVASEALASLHNDDIYNPVDPTTVDSRLRNAGFVAAEVRFNEIGWAATARK